MDTSQTAATDRSSLVQDWLGALRYWLGGRRGLISLAVVLGLAAIALNWGWLVAVGIAPLLLAFAPCAAMCALGLCASRMVGGSCSSKTGTTGDAASQAARPETLPAAAPDPNQLTLGLDDSSTTARPALNAPAAPEGTTGTQTPEEEKIHA
jgi:hypothetical protein